MTISRTGILRAMGIDPWLLNVQPRSGKHPATASASTKHTDLQTAWDTLRRTVAACTACGLCHTRRNTVFAAGNPHARMMVIGEAPGLAEDQQGEPFAGAAGELLDRMLAAIGLDRNTVCITNILKCHPPENRDPQPAEINTCLQHLHQQIALVNPALILAVGRIAAQTLLDTPLPLSQLRQKIHACGANKIPLIVTCHPAYLLRNPADKRKAWHDLQLVQKTLAAVC